MLRVKQKKKPNNKQLGDTEGKFKKEQVEPLLEKQQAFSSNIPYTTVVDNEGNKPQWSALFLLSKTKQ